MRKYGNKPTGVDGLHFDSKREANRYCELRLLEKCGDVRSLAIQPSFDLWVNDHRICRYVADFAYQRRDGSRVVEDVKGVKTPVYQLKKKLMKAIHGIEVVEI